MFIEINITVDTKLQNVLVRSNHTNGMTIKIGTLLVFKLPLDAKIQA